ncbi:MAG: acetyl-CoA carboxylase biotin carboxyl carrier protein [Bacteroides sp.]|nr:acetyl-CoA carboxylase biotin carboxyl carrier protein [Prevotella sp.]MCM1407220.1 acetyl-CoA carboxylase biotin carboxyl carrier protein [Treponema brennaborense]MCM1470372.1 acetyl-CoA carboxylase biotin carboxyl carrier protein [Bacteroides sp.]
MTDSFILQIIDTFDKSSVVALDITRGGDSISLKKSAGVTGTAVPPLPPEIGAHHKNGIAPKPEAETLAAAASEHAAASSAQKENAAAAEKAPVRSAAADSECETIKSPLVGTFFRAAAPDSPAYVEKGDKIKKGDPLCILEAMKMMNTLECEFDCEIVDILAANGDLVEYDQPLFSVKRL